MTDKVQKVAVLGGSFDPVTDAHLEIIRALSAKFSRVVVLPCYISPFKQEGCYASGEDRVKMLRKVTADLENVKVSKWEIKRENVSYSVDAVRHYQEKYEGAEIYFVIGSDCLAGLPEWKDADYLAQNAVFYLIRRPGYAVSKKVIEPLKALGFRFKSAGVKVSDCSSALVRASVAFGKAGDYVPAEAAEYVEKHELYTQFVPFVKAFRIFGVKSERIEHTFRAVKAGITLAKLHGEDIAEVTTALILHDVGKYASAELLEKQEITVPLYDLYAKTAPAVLHAHVSAAIARSYCKVSDRIADAIRKHTTGDAEMSVLDKIVYLADATEEGRDYEGVVQLRRLAAKDLDRAMLYSLKATVKNLKSEGKPICEDTVFALKKFTEIRKAVLTAKRAAPVFGVQSEEPIKREEQAMGICPAELKKGDSKALAYYIAERADEKKGRDILVVDIGQKTVIADYFVIVGAGSTTAVKAIADYVDEKLSKDCGIEPIRRDVSSKWAVIDYGGVILHVQHEEAREFYRLDKLWDNGDNIVRFRR